MSPEPAILLSAGEASGDLHGATLCRALRELHPGVRLVGMGGPRMAAAGMELVADVSGHAVVGTSEALGRIPRLYRAYRLLKARLIEERPRALVVIDFPEFNLRLARIARRAGVPVVYFIPPQLWAWRRGRIRQMARRVSRVLAVLPFEEKLYQDAGVPVESAIVTVRRQQLQRACPRRARHPGSADERRRTRRQGARAGRVWCASPRYAGADRRDPRHRAGARCWPDRWLGGPGPTLNQCVSAKRTVTETSASEAVMSAGNGGNVAPRIIASIAASRSG